MLKVDGIHKSFGGLKVLQDVSLTAQPGTITGIIGPNGAGKSTLFSVISGFIRPDAGSVSLDGERIDRLRPDVIAERGLVRTFQVPREFGDLSVLDNLRVAGSHMADEGIVAALLFWRRTAQAEARVTARAREMLERLNLTGVAGNAARALSGGQKKLLELGRTLMVGPRVLLVDEPFAGVAPALRDQLLTHLKTLRAEGICVLVIEHDIEAVMEISDRICVMVEGTILIEGTPGEVQRDPRVLSAYLGSAPA
ncbi:ABC transporter ATP-binding protein [Rhodoligotrophos defluvii]|uniref:ABC transporter ATP-binding protein n=1 Tax=Rhodoligotrophos defluvii TaxID=2561934 RepID=UPI0010C9644A|nr:ABC transporter ATP-binding protein [Rhodoligotrophos defluvii]